MMLDDDAAYRALLARDARFDGHWFVGVTSTGIYCRPICRVRTPRRENCRFFASAAQAEAAHFRPCLKCRPELAPGPGEPWTVMAASHTLAHQAARLLDHQVASGQGATLAALAARLGISDRHLRRIFVQVHGVTPLQYLQTRRLLLAKQLLTDSALPVTQVAWASGFRSVRRFNAVLAENYHLSPSRLRREGQPADGGAGRTGSGILVLRLAYRPPYDVASLMDFIARRAVPGLEEMLPAGARRTLRANSLCDDAGLPVAHEAGWIGWRFEPARHTVEVSFGAHWATHSAVLVRNVRRWLDLDANPAPIDDALAALGGAAGTRLPGHPDPFEAAVRAVLEQQVSVAAARTLTARLLQRWGTPLATPWPALGLAFPGPASLAEASLDELAALSLPRTRAQALNALARAWPALAARPGLLQPGTPGPLVEALLELPGVGPWTAHYVALRALSCPDLLVPHDAVVREALRRSHGLESDRQIQAHALAWQPWRSYATLRLWQQALATRPHSTLSSE